MDAQRRVLYDGALAVHGQGIVAVGATDALRQRYQAARVLDARRKAVLPGLIDAHAHAGHAMLKPMGGCNGEAWMHACKTIYTSASDENFWEVESHLAALERLKAGVTTGVSLLGGGDERGAGVGGARRARRARRHRATTPLMQPMARPCGRSISTPCMRSAKPSSTHATTAQTSASRSR